MVDQIDPNPFNHLDPPQAQTIDPNPFNHLDPQQPQAGQNPFNNLDPQQSQDQGFIQRVGNDYNQRVDAAQKLADAGVSGKQTMAETIPEMGAQLVAGPINDVAKEAITSVAPYVQKAASYLPGMESYNQGVNTLVKPVAQAAQYASDKYGQAEQAFPRVTNALNALGTTAMAAGNIAGAVKATPLMAGSAYAAIPTSAQGFSEARKAYQVLDKSGTTITANGVNGFLQDAAKGVVTDPKIAGAVGKSAATKYLTSGGDSGEGLMSLANEPVTIQQVHAIDKDLSQQITKHFSDGLDQSGQQLMDLQDTFRKHFMTPDAANVTGGAEGLDAWKQANDLYHKASKMDAVEKVVADAGNTQNPAQAIQTGLKNILKSAKKTRGYTDEELAALQEGAKTGFAEDAIRTFGGRLMTGAGTVIGAGVGGIPGAVVGGGLSFIGGKMLRGSAAAIQERGVNNLLRVMSKGGLKYSGSEVPDVMPPTPSNPHLQLTGPNSTMYADSEGNISRTPNPANEIVNTQPQPIKPMPYNAPYPENPLQKLLPAPGKATLSNDEIAQMRNQINKAPPNSSPIIISPPKLIPSPENMPPLNPLSRAAANLRNASRGNTEIPVQPSDVTNMRPRNQLTPGMAGNLGPKILQVVKQMTAQGIPQSQIEQTIQVMMRKK